MKYLEGVLQSAEEHLVGISYHKRLGSYQTAIRSDRGFCSLRERMRVC